MGLVIDGEEVDYLLPQMEQVRRSGLTNMWDSQSVAKVAEAMGLDDLSWWIWGQPRRGSKYGTLLIEFGKWRQEQLDKAGT